MPAEPPVVEPTAPDGVVPLFPDHNDLTADRINLVVAASGWRDLDRFAEYARAALTFDGRPLLLDADLRPTAVADEALQTAFGIFSIEPWRSNRHLFNVWLLTEQVPDPAPTLNDGKPVSGLPDEVVLYFVRDFEFESVSGIGSFVPPELPDRAGGFHFGKALVDVPSDAPYLAVTNAAHELGHALFTLSDEYVGQVLGFDGRLDLTNYPACAEDRAEARSFWGDLLGQVDPMFEIWMRELDSAGLGFHSETRELLRANVQVRNVRLGCYGVPGSFRATRDSLMNSEIPVLGAVNRRWAERVLALWTG